MSKKQKQLEILPDLNSAWPSAEAQSNAITWLKFYKITYEAWKFQIISDKEWQGYKKRCNVDARKIKLRLLESGMNLEEIASLSEKFYKEYKENES